MPRSRRIPPPAPAEREGDHAHQFGDRSCAVREPRGSGEDRVTYARRGAPRATRQRLTDEERVAARDRAQGCRVDLRTREPTDRLDAQALQFDLARAAGRCRGQRSAQRMLGPYLVVAEGDDQQRRCGLNAAGHEREHVDRRLVGPVRVLDDADRRTVAAKFVEHDPPGVDAAVPSSAASPGSSPAISRKGHSGRGTARSSHHPASRRVARRSATTNARTRLDLPIPASPLTRAIPPRPATAAPNAASSADSEPSRSSNTASGRSPPIDTELSLTSGGFPCGPGRAGHGYREVLR